MKKLPLTILHFLVNFRKFCSRHKGKFNICYFFLFKIIVICLSDKLWYCRLSPNHKVLHYGDVEEDAETPSIEALQEKSE